MAGAEQPHNQRCICGARGGAVNGKVRLLPWEFFFLVGVALHPVVYLESGMGRKQNLRDGSQGACAIGLLPLDSLTVDVAWALCTEKAAATAAVAALAVSYSSSGSNSSSSCLPCAKSPGR